MSAATKKAPTKSKARKVCSKCDKRKSVDEFYRSGAATDGRFSHCKACHALYAGKPKKNGKPKAKPKKPAKPKAKKDKAPKAKKETF